MTSNGNQIHHWSMTVHRLFQPPRNPIHALNERKNPRLARHPRGTIWRQALCSSIFRDLTAATAGDATEGNDMEGPKKRFVRLEYLGLSGVIIYEMPGRRGLQSWHAYDDQRRDPRSMYPEQNHREAHEEGEQEQEKEDDLTLSSIFGDPDDPEDQGMEIDHLLDRVGAQLVYVPLYACTSFATGQVMNGLVRSLPMHPLPAPPGFGFSIDASAYTLFNNGLSSCECSCSASSYERKPVIDISVYLKRTMYPADRVIRDKLVSASAPGSGFGYGSVAVPRSKGLIRVGPGLLDRTMRDEETRIGPGTIGIEAETVVAKVKDGRTENVSDDEVLDIDPNASDPILGILYSSICDSDLGSNENVYMPIIEDATVDDRTSAVVSLSLESADEEDEDALDTSICTTDSGSLDLSVSLSTATDSDFLGPCTPPRSSIIVLNVAETTKTKTEAEHGSGGGISFLSMDADDELGYVLGDAITFFDSSSGEEDRMPGCGNGDVTGVGDVTPTQDKENRVNVLPLGGSHRGPGVRWSLETQVMAGWKGFGKGV